ncbi:alpha-hydroxy-acid oxidizing protein [Pseudomaricurvus alkylphenolicus]|uniref:alpha-hydroxy acid oxidase n=1 Tax=Pseudomaricurvus alkylphenolicus TaxID=1306991 RepID=UPI001420F1A0|nr:alpha-hydroxy acid oxidase [Pseudomaricurvus alkylphenolicus]NIB38742.1 alpha-hydroxy-acid oxidizing protein [Pseudomaricurvus alkylphenolicus]
MSYPIHRKINTIPSDLVSLDDYERLAIDFMPSPVYEYIRSGGGDETTLKQNRSAFSKISLYGRILVDFEQATTKTELLGQKFRHPVLLAPVAHQGLVHCEGEIATSEAAHAMETGLITSTLASKELEHIAEKTDSPKWFQLYFQSNRAETLALVRRAETAGYSALIVTLDVPINGLRNHIQRSGFQLPANLQSIQPSSRNLPPKELTPEQSIIFQGIMSEAPGWQDIHWLQEQTQLPLVIKGITHPQDARMAIDAGVKGIVVSNHGGRGLDSLPATIELLPIIRKAVGDDFTLLLDGGIRRGTDVFKALALGADAVLVGRPQVYALAIAGALGVAHMLKVLRHELEVTMALCGCPTLADINSDCLFSGV